MFKYFVDTADIDYIKNLDLANKYGREYMLGVTTNPNAMSKINKFTLKEWESVLPNLCELVSEIRQDDKGLVHVQAPNSNMTGDQVLEFAEHIHGFNDGNTKLALKIPPTLTVLKRTEDLQNYMPVNVTGLSDCCTALSCLSFGIDYASIIPGRMEEVGINANAHLAFVTKRVKSNGEVITGSMRTVEGLLNAVKYRTIPTIGTRVWDALVDIDLIEEGDKIEYFNECNVERFSPFISQENRDLSVQFFDQMDDLGKKCAEDLS